MTQKTRILIAGAGFAGIYTFKALKKLLRGNNEIEIFIMHPKNYFLFTPLLHEVTTGNQTLRNITEPIRKILKGSNAHFVQTKILGVSIPEKIIETEQGYYRYDYLVLSLGAQTNFYHTPGAKEHCFTLKSLEDAYRLKNQFIDNFERASETDDPEEKKKLLHFVVIGGGPTGVELAAEMADFFYGTFSKYYTPDIIEATKITIIQSHKTLVPQFPSNFHKRSFKRLKHEKIEIRLDCKVQEVTENQVTLSNGEVISTATPIWVAGIEPQQIPFDVEVEKNDKGQIKVGSDLSISNHPNIFVLGDMAEVNDHKGSPLPATAQVATKQAFHTAQNILQCINNQPTLPFIYQSSGTLMSLGKFHALGKIANIPFSGFFAWWLWRTVYLFKIISPAKRVQIAVDWTLHLFTERNISRIE